MILPVEYALPGTTERVGIDPWVYAPDPVVTPYTPPGKKAVHTLLHSSESVEWYTPASIVEPARITLGEITLDPASCAVAQQVVKARRYFIKEDDGLTADWRSPKGVFLNPPYGKEHGQSTCGRFVDKVLHEYRAGHIGAAVVLVNANTSTRWFQALLTAPDSSVCFLAKRVQFWREDGGSRSPTNSNAVFLLTADHATRARFHTAFGPLGTIR